MCCSPGGNRLTEGRNNSAGDAKTQVRSLGQEDPLEWEMATFSSILAWKSPWTEETGRLQSMGSQADSTEHTHSQLTINVVIVSGKQ